jgi:hypothetical protein
MVIAVNCSLGTAFLLKPARREEKTPAGFFVMAGLPNRERYLSFRPFHRGPDSQVSSMLYPFLYPQRE